MICKSPLPLQFTPSVITCFNLWSPYVIGQTIYIFILSFVLLFSSPNFSGRRLDVCHTSTHGVALGCRSETCCTRLAGNAGRKISPKVAICAPSYNFVGLDVPTIWSTSHRPRFYAAANFLKMGIKMPRVIVFWTTSTMKDERSAAEFNYIKTVSGKVVEHSIAFRVVSICWQGDDPFTLKSCLQVTCPLLSMVSYGRCQNS